MSKKVILLTKADSKEEAEAFVKGFMNEQAEYDTFDYYEIGGCFKDDLPDGGIAPLAKCVDVVEKWAEQVEDAKRLRELADISFRGGDNGEAGRYLKRAGQILSQDFTEDCTVFNLEEGDYSIPYSMNGWYAVVVDMHV